MSMNDFGYEFSRKLSSLFPHLLEPHINFKEIVANMMTKGHALKADSSISNTLPHTNYIKYSFLISWISFSFRVEIQWHRKQTWAALENCWRHHVMNSVTPDLAGWSNLSTKVKTYKLFICGEQVCWNIMVKIWVFVCTTDKCLVTSLSDMQPSVAVYWRFINEKPKDRKGSPSTWSSNLKQKILMFNQVICFSINA